VLETFSQWVADQPVLVLSLMAAIFILLLILAGLLLRAGQNNRRLLADYNDLKLALREQQIMLAHERQSAAEKLVLLEHNRDAL
jgi:DNA recombination protein RmuC